MCPDEKLPRKNVPTTPRFFFVETTASAGFSATGSAAFFAPKAFPMVRLGGGGTTFPSTPRITLSEGAAGMLRSAAADGERERLRSVLVAFTVGHNNNMNFKIQFQHSC